MSVDPPDSQSDRSQEQEISLDELAAAYARSIGGPRRFPIKEKRDVEQSAAPGGELPQPRPREPEGSPPSHIPGVSDRRPASDADGGPPLPEEFGDDLADHADDADGADEADPCPVNPRTILEAMLFVGDPSGQPLTAVRAAELMRNVAPEEIAALVDELNHRYAAGGCPYRVVSEGAGYRLALHASFCPIRRKFYGRVREARLSQAALDVLAIVAYRQPITAEEVHRLRGTPSGPVLTQLVRRQLLRIERPPGKRAPLAYRTTDRFLELFGLESLDDLPQAEDIDKQ